MNIFESLKNLNVSEDCFNEIVSIIEDEIHDLKAERRHYDKKVKGLEGELKRARKASSDSRIDLMSKDMDYTFSIRPEEKERLKKEIADAEVRDKTFQDRANDVDRRLQDTRKKRFEVQDKVNKMVKN